MEANITVSAKLGSYEIDCTVLIGSDESIKEQIFEQLQEDHPDIEEDESDIIWEVIDWNGLSDYPNLQNTDLLEEIADCNGSYDFEVLNAAVECNVEISNVDEAYSGNYKDDADFAEETASQICDMPKDMSWPFYCIDWDRAASDLMMDYSEANGYYFRNL